MNIPTVSLLSFYIFSSFQLSFRYVFDLKLLNMVAGIQSSSSIMACPYGLCHRVNAAGKPAPNGRWVTGEARTMRKCQTLHETWLTETGGKKECLRNYGGCKERPVSLYDETKADIPFIQLFAPPILHLLLGNN